VTEREWDYSLERVMIADVAQPGVAAEAAPRASHGSRLPFAAPLNGSVRLPNSQAISILLNKNGIF